MTSQLPPNPQRFPNLRGWAEQLYRFLEQSQPIANRVEPQSVLLAHRTGGVSERASTDGLLLYDPVTRSVVVANNGIWEPVNMDYGIFLAEQEIFRVYGDRVSVASTATAVHHFGLNEDLASATEETVWESGGIVNYPSVGTNPINEIVSDNAGDTSAVTVTTFTDSGSGVLTRLEQSVTLNGTTPVALTACARAERIVLNNGEAALVGNVTVRESATPANVHVSIVAGKQQSYKGAFSTARDEYAIITDIEVAVSKKSNAAADFQVEGRVLGSAFKPITGVFYRSSAGTGDLPRPFGTAPLIVLPNSDVRVQATANSNNVSGSTIILGHYAEVPA